VGRSKEKIRSKGGGFRFETSDVAAKTRESVRERLAQNGTLPLTEMEQPTLDDYTSLVFIPLG
jgi:hypothetical protein